jgi:hypothetical protein
MQLTTCNMQGQTAATETEEAPNTHQSWHKTTQHPSTTLLLLFSLSLYNGGAIYVDALFTIFAYAHTQPKFVVIGNRGTRADPNRQNTNKRDVHTNPVKASPAMHLNRKLATLFSPVVAVVTAVVAVVAVVTTVVVTTHSQPRADDSASLQPTPVNYLLLMYSKHRGCMDALMHTIDEFWVHEITWSKGCSVLIAKRSGGVRRHYYRTCFSPSPQQTTRLLPCPCLQLCPPHQQQQSGQVR